MKKALIFLLILASILSEIALAANAKKLALYRPEQRQTRKHDTNDLLKSYLELSSFRHQVLSQNIANLNTPGYQAEEVDMPSKYDDLTPNKAGKHIRLAVTSNRHIIGASSAGKNKFASHKLKDPFEVKLNGNNVSLAQQMTKIAQNKEDYNAAVKTYATTNSLISMVLGK